MSTGAFLRNYPALRTRKAEELQQWLGPQYAIRAVGVANGGQAVDAVINHCALPSMGLSYARYGSPIIARMSHSDHFVQGFPLSGNGLIHWNRRAVSVAAASGGIAGGPGAEAEFNYNEVFSHLILKFSPEVLTRKLSSLIGHPIDPPLQLSETSNSHRDYGAGQFRLVRFLAEELDKTDAPLSPIALAEIEQAIIVSYLTSNRHNYSLWLHDTPRAAAPWQVRRAVDYIEQNWHQPITIEALTQATQTSTRSLFHLFKRTHGISPMIYVKKVRLRHARSMLTRPTPETSVTSVGFLCGFSNMGNFSRIYYSAFGELPSDTLKAHR